MIGAGEGSADMKTLFLAGALVASAAASAQTYPDRPIHLVVPFAPGGVDVTARLLQPGLQQDLGQPIVIENRPGAGGVTGTVVVSKSPPDGFTLLMTTSGTLVNAPLLAKTPPFDPIKDFTPITVTFQAVSTLVVNAALPIHSVKELVDYARQNPGKLGFASAGIGTNQHIDGETLKTLAGIDMVHVPYKSFGQSIADLTAGHVQLGFNTLAQIRPHVASGKVRLIAVGDAKRYAALPDVPTIAETMPGFARVPGWSGAILGPAGLPAPILARLNGATVKAIHRPEVRARLEEGGSVAIANTPEEFTALMRGDIERMTRVIRTLNLQEN